MSEPIKKKRVSLGQEEVVGEAAATLEAPSSGSAPPSPWLGPTLDDSYDDKTDAAVSLEMSGYSLLDLLVSIEAHWDLFFRKAKPRVSQIIQKTPLLRAASYSSKSREGQELRSRRPGNQRLEQELVRLRKRIGERIDKLSDRWNDAKVVSVRDKVSFFTGVMNVLISALIAGFRPGWVPAVYTLQCLFMLPLRVYSYRRRSFHYFLFDFCYYLNVLLLAFIWIFPSSPTLWLVVYCLSHGPLCTAIATWNNSLVFHQLDKVTSTFIHAYPPFVCMAIRHLVPDAQGRFPGLAKTPTLGAWRPFWISTAFYALWQVAYLLGVSIRRKEKIKAGRVTSFTYLRDHNKGWVGKTIRKTPEWRREPTFMICQTICALIGAADAKVADTNVTLAPSLLLYHHALLNGLWIIAFFGVATWNGGTFYLQIYGRKFEREVQRLQSELHALQAELTSRDSGSASMSRTNSDLGSPIKSLGSFEAVESVPPLDLNEESYFDREPHSGGDTVKAVVQSLEAAPPTRRL